MSKEQFSPRRMYGHDTSERFYVNENRRIKEMTGTRLTFVKQARLNRNLRRIRRAEELRRLYEERQKGL